MKKLKIKEQTSLEIEWSAGVTMLVQVHAPTQSPSQVTSVRAHGHRSRVPEALVASRCCLMIGLIVASRKQGGSW